MTESALRGRWRARALPGLATAVVLLLLAGCREAPVAAPPGGGAFSPVAEAEAACSRTGGAFLRAGGGTARACIHSLADSGKSCRSSGDCEGDCLARSGTCAPMAPLYGCHEILMSTGARAMQCRE